MAIRLSGLNSGMDTDAIVQALMSAKSMKKTKIEGKKTKLEWKKDLWSELNTKIYSFYNTTLSKIKMQGAYKTKAATSSDTSKVTATATSSAAEGTYKVKVNKLASAQYVTSGKLGGTKDKDGNIVKASASTKLVDLLDK
ncbi:MAG TPA: flagellar hook protein, partial [Lachnospiraceae bacterium]|nr:flagellar hook protein [Lachnospiraceae bacterium]